MAGLILTAGLLTGCAGKEVLSGQKDNGKNESFTKNKISTDVIEANTKFSMDIFRQLNKEDMEKNIFISPFSISTALTMTYQGAAAATKEVMAKTLGYTGLENTKLNESYKNLISYLNCADEKLELNISNSIWIQDGEEIRRDFIAVNKENYDAQVTMLDFDHYQAAEQINRWIFKATGEKISKMIDPPIPSDIVMYLINAVYFKGDWAEQFDGKNTFKTQFRAGNGSANEIMMMSRTGKVQYGEGDGFQAVRLPYGSGKTAMYCILPGETETINDFIARWDVRQWKAIRDSMAERSEVLLQLPRFDWNMGLKI
jgi:serpin B